MSTNLELKGYEFGKALNQFNADPEYYANRIAWGAGYSREERNEIYAGCLRALTEVSRETLIANTVNHVTAMLDMSDKEMASPWEIFEAESFESGVDSILRAIPTVVYAPVDRDSIGYLNDTDMEKSRQAFQNGIETGKKIMNAWKAAGL